MAENFTDADQRKLDELMQRRDRAEQERAEADAAQQREAFKVLEPLFKSIDMSKVKPALEAGLASRDLSQETLARLQRLSQILNFDFEQGLLRDRERFAPTATPVENK